MSLPKIVRFSRIERHNSPTIIPMLNQRLERRAAHELAKFLCQKIAPYLSLVSHWIEILRQHPINRYFCCVIVSDTKTLSKA